MEVFGAFLEKGKVELYLELKSKGLTRAYELGEEW